MLDIEFPSNTIGAESVPANVRVAPLAISKILQSALLVNVTLPVGIIFTVPEKFIAESTAKLPDT